MSLEISEFEPQIEVAEEKPEMKEKIVVDNKEKESTESDEAMVEAEKIVQNMLRESKQNIEGEEFDNLVEDEDESVNNVDDLAKKHYEAQLNLLKEEQDRKDHEKAEEIAELKRLLEETLNAQEDKSSVASNEEVVEQDDGKKTPIVQTVDLNGTRTKVLICSFTRDGGRIGLQIKRFRSQFFVMGVLEGMQAAKYANVGPGLLVYQIVSSAPGKETGRNISVESAGALADAINAEFENGRMVTMKFLIPPANIPVHMIHQEVIKLPVTRKVRVLRGSRRF